MLLETDADLSTRKHFNKLPVHAQAGELPAGLVLKLETVAVREGISLADVFLTAFEILLLRYSRGEESLATRITVPTDTGPRHHSLNVTLDYRAPLRDAFREVSQAARNVALPFAGAIAGGRWTVKWPELPSQGENSGSWLRVTLQTGGIVRAEIAAPRPFGAPDFLVRVSHHWLNLLEGLTLPASTPVSDLPLIDDNEMSLLQDWSNESLRSQSPEECLTDIFAATVRRVPDKIAIEFGDQSMTYAELDSLSTQLAELLHARGAGPGKYVGLMLSRSLDLYVSLLAILKSGAAYVPIDPNYPADRISYILGDCEARLLVVHSSVPAARINFDGEVIWIDQELSKATPPAKNEITFRPSPTDVAYVIYTSGTTGRPKGVQIEHRSVSRFVRSEVAAFGVRPEDRVYQGFSIAFDASVEEVWLAFSMGGTLVPATAEMVRSGPSLGRHLTEAKVTVFSTVPTLLSVLEDEIPTVKLLILGGERCSQELVASWAKPWRRMVNSYGPTEATVVTTFSNCDPSRPVTIGRPLPNYSVYVLAPNLRPMPIGLPGELHIGGDCLARGYLGLPALTAEKFVDNPFSLCPGARLYKTGDLVRFNASGEIEFLGRIDGQVKLRGFRIELSEIESVILTEATIRNAVVTIREDQPGIQSLIGYVVLTQGSVWDEDRVKAKLRERLPAFMVPTWIEVVADLPTLASGKVDRKALPAPRPRLNADGVQARGLAPRTELEKKIAEVWGKLFHPVPVSIQDDFFDLGGHSLLAARLVSELRRDPALASIAVREVYLHRTIEKISKRFDHHSSSASAPSSEAARELPNGAAPITWRTMVAQSAHVAGVILVFSALILIPWLTERSLRPMSLFVHLAGTIVALMSTLPLMVVISIAAKWTLIGRYRAGEYPLWGSYYWRFWFVRRLQAMVPLAYFRGTPLMNLYARLMGAKIDPDAFLGSQHLQAFDLIKIGTGASIGMDAELLGYTIERGRLRVGPIEVGKGAFVGVKAVLSPSTSVGAGAALGDMSMLPENGQIPPFESWVGSPAEPNPRVSRKSRRMIEPSPRLRRALFLALHGILLLTLFMIPLIALLPILWLSLDLYAQFGVWPVLVFSPFITAAWMVLFCGLVTVAKWTLLGRIRPGRYPIQSFFYLRKWFVDSLMQLSLESMHSLYATLYIAPWFRLLGAKLGKRVEISTVAHISPDLLSIGAESFIADSAVLGAPQVDRGKMTIAAAEIGRRTFVGNSALIPIKTKLPDASLIGVLSVPPANPRDISPGSSWLGSPALFLPRRQTTQEFPAHTTFTPPVSLYLIRGFIEFFRVTLPGALGLVSVWSCLLIMEALVKHWGILKTMLVSPLLGVIASVLACLATIAIKWIVIGKYRAVERPLWSHFVWRNELVTAVHESLAVPALLNVLQGTTWLSWYFRAMGSKIGKRVFMETTQITEFDLVEIGDDVNINLNATIQTHLFEDRVMKTSSLKVGNRATIGFYSVVLYDSEMRAGSSLGSLSLLMKGERILEATRWHGSPPLPLALPRLKLAREAAGAR